MCEKRSKLFKTKGDDRLTNLLPQRFPIENGKYVDVETEEYVNVQASVDCIGEMTAVEVEKLRM